MQRKFERLSATGSLQVAVALSPAGDVTVYVSWRNGFGGGGRTERLGQAPTLVAYLIASGPGYVLADALEEMGLDAGAADVIRNN